MIKRIINYMFIDGQFIFNQTALVQQHTSVESGLASILESRFGRFPFIRLSFY